MTKTAPISYAGLALIKAFEGFRANATLLPNGIWVIGHGHTVSAKEGGIVDEKDAETLLIWDMSQLAPKIKDCIFAPLSQAQMDALLSLAFNIGMDNFASSDVVRYLNEGNILGSAAAFDVWRKAHLGGHEVVLDALVRRRTAEKARFLDVEQGVVLAPSARLQPESDTELAGLIEADSKKHADEQNSVEVSIDLSNSAALGSLLTADNINEDGILFSSKPKADIEPEIIYSDDDPEQEEAANIAEAKPKDEEPKQEAEEQTDTSTEKLVPLGGVFDEQKSEAPIREVAENISGRLASIAVELNDSDEEIKKDTALDDDKDIQNSMETEVEEPLAAEPEFEDLPPISDDEPKSPPTALDEDVLALDFADRIFDDVPPVMDFDEGDEPSPQSLSSELAEPRDQPFEVLEKRNTGMFTLMGISGLILGAGGIYETSKSETVVTLTDMIKGPGLAGFGILLVLVTLYFLFNKPKNKKV